MLRKRWAYLRGAYTWGGGVTGGEIRYSDLKTIVLCDLKVGKMPDKKITDLTSASFDGKREISLIGSKFLDDGAIIIRHCTLDSDNMQFFIIEGTGVSNPKISND